MTPLTARRACGARARPRPVTAVAGLVLAAPGLTGCAGGSGSGAQCAAPPTSLSAQEVAAGGTVEVGAEGLWDGCDDGVDHEELNPRQDIGIFLVQEGREVELAAVDAEGEAARISEVVTIPVDAVPGPAQIRVETDGSTADLVITDPP